MYKKNSGGYWFPLFLFFIVIIGALTSFLIPKKAKSSNFTSASATLGNSRFSFVGGVTTGAAGSSNITIDTSSSPDNDVDHLFPKDTVCFTNAAFAGCSDETAFTVVSTEGVGLDQFTIAPSLTTGLSASDIIVATASGSLVISFTLANEVPDGGDLLITIPMANGASGNDNFPDYEATIDDSGFDLNSIAVGDISTATTTSGTCSNAHWTATETITPGSGATDHTIRIDRSGSSCEANSTVITVTIDSDPGIINPAPINTSRTRGAADEYTLNIKSRDNADLTVDESDVMVAPVEAVLVSATVDETLTFRVCGVKTDLSTQEATCFSTPADICGSATLDVSSYAFSVPFGTITSADTFLDAAQYLTVSTNADAGYAVTVQQTDQMGKDGITCSGNPTDPIATNCIPDNPGDGTLDFDTSDDCDTAATNGLCFSADNAPQSGTPTFAVEHDIQTNDCDGSPTFCARSSADIESSEAPETIISTTGPVSTSDAFVCWRLSIDGTQPAGYYYNKVKYVATPIF